MKPQYYALIVCVIFLCIIEYVWGDEAGLVAICLGAVSFFAGRLSVKFQ